MRRGYIALLACVLLLLASCEHKELCFDHDMHAFKSEVRVEAQYEREWQYTYAGGTDWKTFPTWQEEFGRTYDALRPALPEGLRVQIYNTDAATNIVNIAPEGGIVYIRPGEHALLFYNNDTEYIVFDAMDSFASAKATTRTRTRASYLGNSYMDPEMKENTVSEPDMLYGNYRVSYFAERVPEIRVMPVAMHPLVFTYLVRYEFERGQEYVALARGALAGMARSVWLNSGHTSKEAATVLYDCAVEKFGVEALVETFGVPDFPNDHYNTRAQRYGLNLEVRLKNGKIKSFDFDVTDQVIAQPQGGVIVVRGIEITEEEGSSGGSGFDVDVESWGDYEDIDLPI